MKLWIFASCLSMTLTGWSLAQHTSELLSITKNEDQFYDLPQLSNEDKQRFLEHPSSSILVCPQGASLPLNFFLKGDLLELETSIVPSYRLNIKQTFYLRFQDKQILISLDGSTWKAWQEVLTGMLSASLNVQEQGPQLELGLDMHLR